MRYFASEKLEIIRIVEESAVGIRRTLRQHDFRFLLKDNTLSMAHCDAVNVGRPSHHPINEEKVLKKT